MIMRFAALILLWWSAALARAQYSAVETDVVDPTEVVAPSSTTQSIPGTTPSITAAVLFPSASSAWSHNGTAYLKYSLPDGVSPKSVSYVLANDNAGLIKAGNSKIEELKSYFVYQTMMRSTAQPAGAGSYWIKWIPAYGKNPDDVQPGTGYKIGVAFRVGDSSQPLQFAWSVPFEIRADSSDTLPADVSAYPANATKSDWVPPNGPTQAAAVAGASRLAPALGIGIAAAVVAAL